jgi:N-acetylmuramoyl-L-alanine amidase
MYKVVSNWLWKSCSPIPKVSCNRQKYSRGNNICDYIILHYTAGPSLSSAHNTFKTPSTNVSWHITIDRDGSLYQLYDFRKRCWHAGISNWKKPNGKHTGGLNKWAIGIEMIAGGPLTIKNGNYYGWWGGRPIPETEVYIDTTGQPWHSITNAQKEACQDIIPVLAKKYKCVDLLGHSEISPTRKIDPGPQGMEEIVQPIRYAIWKR